MLTEKQYKDVPSNGSRHVSVSSVDIVPEYDEEETVAVFACDYFDSLTAVTKVQLLQTKMKKTIKIPRSYVPSFNWFSINLIYLFVKALVG